MIRADATTNMHNALNWLREQEISINGFAAPCQCEDGYLDEKGLCPKGQKPEDCCPYYNFRGTGECWIECALTKGRKV